LESVYPSCHKAQEYRSFRLSTVIFITNLVVSIAKNVLGCSKGIISIANIVISITKGILAYAKGITSIANIVISISSMVVSIAKGSLAYAKAVKINGVSVKYLLQKQFSC